MSKDKFTNMCGTDKKLLPLDLWDSKIKGLEKAAIIVVKFQQGSPSLLRRKMKIGVKRSEILIEWLTRCGILGPDYGSKCRDVLIEEVDKIPLNINNYDFDKDF